MTTFDYIVVGAGSAGAVVANRLAKSGQHSVLVLEAGPKDINPLLHMPGGTQQVLKSDSFNWKIDSEPQEHLNNRRLMQHRGKVLGGSSNVNGMVAIRGSKQCYDSWAEQGCEGWDYENVLNNFKSIENWCDTDNDYHSSKGELPIMETKGDSVLFDRFIDAGIEVGLKPNHDFNGERQEGVGRYHANVHKGERWGSAKTFLTPLKKQGNLTIKTGVQVEKVIIENGRATGIQATKTGKLSEHKLVFSANKEVILCGGAFQSPQLLMLSGIGNSDKLKALDIPVVQDLPGVGENLQDHLSLLINFKVNLPITLNGPSNSLIGQAQIALEYFTKRTGYGALNMIEAGAFIHSREGLDASDIQLHLVPCLMYNLTDQPPEDHGISVRSCNLTPYSRGVVELHSKNPIAPPKIDFRFLSDERDIPVIIEAYKQVIKIANASAWKGILDPTEVKGGPADLNDDEAILEWVRQYVETDYHPVGTCKMGVDDMAVVDPELKVKGIEGLRVADASIMPTIVRGNTNIPCMMIGDKCAELILNKL